MIVVGVVGGMTHSEITAQLVAPYNRFPVVSRERHSMRFGNLNLTLVSIFPYGTCNDYCRTRTVPELLSNCPQTALMKRAERLYNVDSAPANKTM